MACTLTALTTNSSTGTDFPDVAGTVFSSLDDVAFFDLLTDTDVHDENLWGLLNKDEYKCKSFLFASALESFL